MIVTGNPIPAAQAEKIGLVDKLVPKTVWLNRAWLSPAV